jgi:plasmid stabilization system protein ParE
LFWSKLATDDLESVFQYLLSEWNARVAENFLNLVDEVVVHISLRPQMYPLINKSLGVRKCVVTKHNSLYYRVLESYIEIARLFDNRQDPQRLKFKY